MVNQITNVVVKNCKEDGIKIGAGIKVDIKGLVSNNNGGNGLVLDSKSSFTVDNADLSNNGKNGLLIIDSSLIQQIGLPQDTDIEELYNLLRQLQSSEESNRAQILSESFLSNLNNYTGIVNNILQILPNLPSF